MLPVLSLSSCTLTHNLGSNSRGRFTGQPSEPRVFVASASVTVVATTVVVAATATSVIVAVTTVVVAAFVRCCACDASVVIMKTVRHTKLFPRVLSVVILLG